MNARGIRGALLMAAVVLLILAVVGQVSLLWCVGCILVERIVEVGA